MDMTKDELFKRGDYSREANSYRARIAVRYTGVSQSYLGQQINRTESSMSTMLSGKQYASRELLIWLFDNKAIHSDFILFGDHRHLSPIVSDGLAETAQAMHGAEK